MPNKNYNSGRAFEYRVKKHLEKKGYYVMRSAGSKSPFDLIAIPTDENISLVPEVVLVQCKHGAKISKVEREKIRDLEFSFSCSSACVVAWSKKNGAIEFYEWAFESRTSNEEQWTRVKWI